MKKLYLIFIFVATSIFAFGAKQPYFIGTCDKDPLSYKIGEQMTFSVNLVDKDGNILEGQKLKWKLTKDCSDEVKEGEIISSKKPLVLSTKMFAPGYARLTVIPVDANGNRLKNMDIFDASACAGFEHIRQITPEPKDYDAFWAKQISELNKIPIKCYKKEVEGKKGYKTYILTIDCVGAPAKAWLTIPENAKPNSLGIIMNVHGYGVGLIKPTYYPYAITLSVERHSYELNQPKEYYDNQRKLLRNFGLKKNENKNPENNYFKNMILRDIRALQYTKTIAEWNKKDITVFGGSMGGFQAIFVASLDKDITKCGAAVPWMCNLNGENEGKIKSHFKPDFIPEILYFDSTNAVKRIKCPIRITARLGDFGCPPSSITILYHNAKNATLEFEFNGGHTYKSPWKDNKVSKKSKRD